MNRRSFLKTVFGAGAALALPVPFLDEPSTRTVIDLNPQALPLDKLYPVTRYPSVRRYREIVEAIPRPAQVLFHQPGGFGLAGVEIVKLDDAITTHIRENQEQLLHNIFHDLRFFEEGQWMKPDDRLLNNDVVHWKVKDRETAQEELPGLFATEPGWTIDENGRLRRG